MTLGFVILVHENFDRVAQLVRHLSDQDCPVALHVDARVDRAAMAGLQRDLSGCKNVLYPPSVRCEWGRFSLVQATLNGVELLLDRYPNLHHVSLISGSCLPTRPIAQLKAFLAKNRMSDFIESVSVENDKWVAAGLNEERFTLYFPFSWRSNRSLFDLFVTGQRKLSISRKIPENIVPHTGSQWWCLTRDTLRKILDDPKRAANDRYFKHCWIPDESYFQSLVRTHSERIVAQSLTFAKFDAEGRPFVLYDDHFDQLEQTETFFARKVWSGADQLYDRLLNADRKVGRASKERSLKLHSYFEDASDMRNFGGVGRYNPGRFPGGKAGTKPQTARPYAVYIGLGDLFEQVPDWLSNHSNLVQHGNLFHRKQIEFADKMDPTAGNLTGNVKIRNRDPHGFLMNLLWNQKENHHGFQFDLRDHQRVRNAVLKDAHARVLIIRESWILKYIEGVAEGKDVLSYARRLQTMERSLLGLALHKSTNAQVKVIDLQDALQDPAMVLDAALDMLAIGDQKTIKSMPVMIDTHLVNSVISDLRNQGMGIQSDPLATRAVELSSEETLTSPRLVK